MHKSGRYYELDALRGLAALGVFIYHSILLLAVYPPWLVWVIKTPMGLLLYGGHQAVILFFVLSGFVLYLSYQRSDRAGEKTVSYLAFVCTRICRIYLPYLGALVFFVLAYIFFYKAVRPSGLSDLYGWRSLTLPTVAVLIRDHILFIGFFHREYLNGATWTLAEEMRISLIFPLLAALALRLRARVSLLLALCCSSTVSIAIHVIHHRTPFEPFHYASLFLLGAVLASNRTVLITCWQRSGKRRQAVIGVAAVLVASYALPLMARFPRVVTEEVSDWLIAVSISVALVAALSDNFFSRFLRKPLTVRLGRISYGIYLLHLPILFVFVNLLWSRVHPLLVFTLSLAVTLVLAEFFYTYLERPSMAFGKSLARAIDRPREARPTPKQVSASEASGPLTPLESVSSA